MGLFLAGSLEVRLGYSNKSTSGASILKYLFQGECTGFALHFGILRERSTKKVGIESFTVKHVIISIP